MARVIGVTDTAAGGRGFGFLAFNAGIGPCSDFLAGRVAAFASQFQRHGRIRAQRNFLRAAAARRIHDR